MNNSTASTPSPPDYGKAALKKLLPVAIAITLANGLVFALFYRRKNLQTSSNYLLLGLAVCDFFTGAINIPYFIVFSFEVVPPSIQTDYSYWLYILHTLMAVSAAYHILVITAEKYLAIVRPLKHYLVTKKTVLKMLAGIWITSASIAVIPLFWKNSQSHVYFIVHSSVCLVVVFVLPYAFMIYAYIVMFKAITSRRRPSSTHKDRSRLHKKSIHDQKCILVFAVMAAVFAFCWLPYFTIALLLNIKLHLKSNISKLFLKTTEVFVFVRYTTSIINPLLYTFFKRDFWQALRNLHVKSGYMYRRTSSTYSKSPSLPHDRVTRKRNSIADNSMLTRLSRSGETTSRANDKRKINTTEEHMVFISSV